MLFLILFCNTTKTHLETYTRLSHNGGWQISSADRGSVCQGSREQMRVWEPCRAWEMKGRMDYNDAKTKAMFVEATGRIWPPVVSLADNRVSIDE